jgi:hypothetical protein
MLLNRFYVVRLDVARILRQIGYLFESEISRAANNYILARTTRVLLVVGLTYSIPLISDYPFHPTAFYILSTEKHLRISP